MADMSDVCKALRSRIFFVRYLIVNGILLLTEKFHQITHQTENGGLAINQ